MKNIKERGLKEDSKGFIRRLVLLAILVFMIILLFPGVRHNLDVWFNNIVLNLNSSIYNNDGGRAVGVPEPNSEITGSIKDSTGTW